jgi:hypothetical protein
MGRREFGGNNVERTPPFVIITPQKRKERKEKTEFGMILFAKFASLR